MKKFITVLLLLTVIVATGTYSLLYIAFNLREPENRVNRLVRKPVLKYPLLRKLLRLQQVGDARYEYMYKRAMPLEIYLYYQEGVQLEPQTLEKISREIQFVTHKYAPIKLHEPQLLTGIPDKATDDDINRILDTYGSDTPLLTKSVPLHIFVLNYYLPHPSYAGLVTDAHSMMLFKDPIRYVSENEDSPVAVEISTILHEFAHLGGADHIDDPGCIMADTVETLNFFSKLTDLRDSYCEADLAAIARALEY